MLFSTEQFIVPFGSYNGFAPKMQRAVTWNNGVWFAHQTLCLTQTSISKFESQKHFAYLQFYKIRHQTKSDIQHSNIHVMSVIDVGRAFHPPLTPGAITDMHK